MKKLVFKTALLALAVWIPAQADAGIKVHINIPFPPAIFFPAAPQLVVIPGTHVYAAPDLRDDIFFHAGWWWRQWNNRWYRSQYHDRGWAYYPHTPYFHTMIPANWRVHYQNRVWKGHRWEPQRVHYRDIHHNWQAWQKNRHWEKQRYGIQRADDRRHAPRYSSPAKQLAPKTVAQNRTKGPGDSRPPVTNNQRPSGWNNRR